jgi:peroxiredoxin
MMNTIKYVSVLAIFGFLLQAGLTAQAAEGVNDQKPKAAEEDKLPRPAPDFTLKDLDGKAVQLSKLTEKGKIVVLEWFNYDCPFVKAHYTPEMNTMGKLAEKYKGKDVVWLTINSTHTATAETNAAWAKEHGIKQTILIDSDGKVGRLYKAKTTPHLFVIDKAGKIVYDGAIDNAPLGNVPEGQKPLNYVEQALTELIAGKPVSTPKTKLYGCSVKYAKGTEPEKPA